MITKKKITHTDDEWLETFTGIVDECQQLPTIKSAFI